MRVSCPPNNQQPRTVPPLRLAGTLCGLCEHRQHVLVVALKLTDATVSPLAALIGGVAQLTRRTQADLTRENAKLMADRSTSP